jgi:FecR protein
MKAPSVVTSLFAVVLSTLCASAACGESVTFSRISGSVRVEVAGVPTAVRNGIVLKTPIRIVTGADGALHIEQPSSALDIGPDSVIVVPGTDVPGTEVPGTNGQRGAVEKILQELGRVLYSVKPRKNGTYAVETPYLVSVVKGTTFSIAIDDSSTAVTLLEGLVEVSGPGTDDRVVLQPNQRAVRNSGDRNIAVSVVDTTAALTAPRLPTNPAPASLQVADSPDQSLNVQSDRVAEDLGQMTASHIDSRSLPNPPGSETPDPNAPHLPIPAPQPEPTPAPPIVPNPDLTPAPQPDPLPIPNDDDDHDDDDDNGHGNEDDDEDDSNPGRGQ